MNLCIVYHHTTTISSCSINWNSLGDGACAIPRSRTNILTLLVSIGDGGHAITRSLTNKVTLVSIGDGGNAITQSCRNSSPLVLIFTGDHASFMSTEKYYL